jgi:hypothetical protein
MPTSPSLFRRAHREFMLWRLQRLHAKVHTARTKKAWADDRFREAQEAAAKGEGSEQEVTWTRDYVFYRICKLDLAQERFEAHAARCKQLGY